MFKRMEGDTAVVVTKGKYQQGDLYEWDGKLFVKVGSSFIRLCRDGKTSVSSTHVEMVYCEGTLYADRFGRLATQPAADRTPVLATPEGIKDVAPLLGYENVTRPDLSVAS